MISFKHLLIASLLLAGSTLDMQAARKHAHTTKRLRDKNGRFGPNPAVYKRFPNMFMAPKDRHGRFISADQKQANAQQEYLQKKLQLEQQIESLKANIAQLALLDLQERQMGDEEFEAMLERAQLNHELAQDFRDNDRLVAQLDLQAELFNDLQKAQRSLNALTAQKEKETVEQEVRQALNDIEEKFRQTNDYKTRDETIAKVNEIGEIFYQGQKNKLDNQTNQLTQESENFFQAFDIRMDARLGINSVDSTYSINTQSDSQ